MKTFTTAFLAAVPLVLASPCAPSDFKYLVSFGDSYTDEARLNYTIDNGELPPAGTVLPEVPTASGGRSWPGFVSEKLGVKRFNYAVGGASCSQAMVARRPVEFMPVVFPGVVDYEIDTFVAELDHPDIWGGESRTAENTVYTLWVGPNDLGLFGFLDDSNAEGTTIADIPECMFDVFDRLYATGGRRFVLFTQLPLERTPQYVPEHLGGREPTFGWPTKDDVNATRWQHQLEEYTTAVSSLSVYGARVQLLLEDRWPGAVLTVFDARRKMLDMYAEPEAWLDGSANKTSPWRLCTDDFFDCDISEETLDSHYWYDDTHASPKIRKYLPHSHSAHGPRPGSWPGPKRDLWWIGVTDDDV